MELVVIGNFGKSAKSFILVIIDGLNLNDTQMMALYFMSFKCNMFNMFMYVVLVDLSFFYLSTSIVLCLMKNNLCPIFQAFL